MAKHVPLQLLMVNLTNGRRGLFIGVPLVEQDAAEYNTEVANIMFSDIQQMPGKMTVEDLLKMVREEVCPRDKSLN